MTIILLSFFFFNDTATTEIYTLSLHDALPISSICASVSTSDGASRTTSGATALVRKPAPRSCASTAAARSEEHTSELQSRQYLVCRLLLEKKKKYKQHTSSLPAP